MHCIRRVSFSLTRVPSALYIPLSLSETQTLLYSRSFAFS